MTSSIVHCQKKLLWFSLLLLLFPSPAWGETIVDVENGFTLELPDVGFRGESLGRFYLNRSVRRTDVHSPFVVRTFKLPIVAFDGSCLIGCLQALGRLYRIGTQDAEGDGIGAARRGWCWRRDART